MTPQPRSFRAKLGRRIDLAGLALALAWVVGQIATDRTYLTQYLWWVPTMWMAGGVAALGLAALVVGLRARGARPLPWSLVLSAVMAGWLFGVEWRSILPKDTAPATFTLVSWNATDVGEDTLRSRLVDLAPDVAAVVNAPWGGNFTDLAGRFPEVIHSGAFLLVSRAPVTRWATADLLIPAMERGVPYGGRALFAELVVGGAPRTLWVVDLPSDPRLSRRDSAQTAARRLAEWSGPVYVRSERGWRSEPSRGKGFPPPDVVVGDFNSPRGSASLEMLTPGLRDAFTQAGHADPASWPRDRPWWALDQVFVRAPLRAASYEVIDPREGDHRLVRVGVR